MRSSVLASTLIAPTDRGALQVRKAWGRSSAISAAPAKRTVIVDELGETRGNERAGFCSVAATGGGSFLRLGLDGGGLGFA